jgi:putative hydrolase of the HAD superfamily
MIKVILSDLGNVLLFSKDKSFKGKLNPIYAEEKDKDNFDFFDHFELNTELLQYYEDLKQKGVRFFMLTEGGIQDDPAIKNDIYKIFEKVYSSGVMGLSKKDSKVYEKVVEDLDVEPGEVLYIDDSVDNVGATKDAGLQVVLYKNNQSLFGEVEKYLE